MPEGPRVLLAWPGWVMLIAALALSGLGIVGIYTGELDAEGGLAMTYRQIAALTAGLLFFVLVNLIGIQRLGRWSYPLFGLVLILLILLVVARHIPMAPFIKAKRNAYRWIEFGPVGLQVSETAKIVFVLATAWYLRFRASHRTLPGLVPPLLFAVIPAGLVLVEPDLGTSLLFLPTVFAMLFAAGARLRHLGLLALILAIAAPAFYFSPFMADYQRQRVQVLLRQNESDQAWQMSAGYQLRQSKIALGSGRLLGQGLAEAAFFRHNLLPEEHNDFIFAVLGFQWGFVGCIGVLACYLLLIAACLTAASITRAPFARLVAVGVAAMLAAQTLINIGMTVGLMPITGMTLPFVSFGGSGLLTNYTALALAASAARHRTISFAPRSFEFDDKPFPP